jgi:ABC-2 type transport system ATP-binding protein
MDIAIHTEGLSKHYGSLVALAPLNLDVYKGEILGYLGPNGAGKTTTIRALLGLIKPTSGYAEIFGINTQTDKVKAHRRLAYVPGEATFWPSLTGAETLHLLGKIHGTVDPKYQKQLIKRFKFDPSKKIRTYSKGNRQKINIIAAFSTRADLLIMDEPTSGLDPIMEQSFKETALEAKNNGQTLFLSSHVLEEVEALCDRVGILRSGKLVELGTLAQMRHLSAISIEATFDAAPPHISHLEGASNIKITGHQLTCQIRGPIEPLLHEIIKAHPKTLLSREPSLEELFLSLYGDEDVRNKATNNE